MRAATWRTPNVSLATRAEMMFELSPLLTAAKPSARSIPARDSTSRSKPIPVTRSPLKDGRSLRKASGSRSMIATVFPRSSRMWASVEPTRPQPMITICTTRPFTVRHRPGRARLNQAPRQRYALTWENATPEGEGYQVGFQVGEAIEVTAEDVAQGGWCVARPAGLPVVFVRHALPGERVIARVTEVTSRFARAEATEVLRPSPDRVEPPCPNARPGGCGGCDWQHASLPAQRPLKAAVIGQHLRRLAGIDREVTVEPLPGDEAGREPELITARGGTPGLGWRTRVQFAVREDGVAGLRAHRSHEVIDIGDCLIAHPGIAGLGLPRRAWPGAATVEAVVGSAGPRGEPAQRAVIITSAGQRGRSGRPDGTVRAGTGHRTPAGSGRRAGDGRLRSDYRDEEGARAVPAESVLTRSGRR